MGLLHQWSSGRDRDFAIMQRTVKRVRWTCHTRRWFEPTPRRAAAINRTMSKTAGKIPCQKSQGRPMAKTDDDLTANSRRGEKEERQSERRSCYLRLLVQTNMFSRWVRDAKRSARAFLVPGMEARRAGAVVVWR
jgi:hypothetical protein